MTLFLTPPDCQKNIYSKRYGSISRDQFFRVSDQDHSMGFPLALIEPKTIRGRDESRFSSSSPVSRAPCLEMHCYTGRSLVLFLNHFDRIWLPYDELPPPFPEQTIASQKSMITVVWDAHGFHVIQSLPKGVKWIARCYSDNILSQIVALRDVASHRKMIVHDDDAGPHVVKCLRKDMDHNSLKRAPHPPYSPNLVPSDFYLFGYVKHQL
jgi:hypothetical protein